MKTVFHFDGVTPTEAEKKDMAAKLAGLEKYITIDPATLNAYLIDDAGKSRKNGKDQVVHLCFVQGKDKIVIEEVDDHHMKSFADAYHRLKRTLEKRHEKEAEIER